MLPKCRRLPVMLGILSSARLAVDRLAVDGLRCVYLAPEEPVSPTLLGKRREFNRKKQCLSELRQTALMEFTMRGRDEREAARLGR